MSIIWLEAFTSSVNSENLLAVDRLNIVIYLNLIPVILFLLFYVIYRMDVYMQKAPSKNLF